MDDLDRRLLNLLQDEIPIAERPFALCGERLGLSEAEVIRRLRAMQESGAIRRVGPSFDPRLLGCATTLAAARVPEEKLEEAAAFISRFAEVTHNYERDDEFNVWFTLVARSREAIEEILDDIRRNTAVEELIDLPITAAYKTRVRFELGSGHGTD